MDFWGPRMWKLMHQVSYCYSDNPDEELKKVFGFFYLTIIPKIIPCNKCRRHYLVNLQTFPPRLKNKRKLTRWVVDVHNEVNKSKAKPVVSYEFAEQLYRDQSFPTEIKQLTLYFQKRVAYRKLSITTFQNYCQFIKRLA